MSDAPKVFPVGLIGAKASYPPNTDKPEFITSLECVVQRIGYRTQEDRDSIAHQFVPLLGAIAALANNCVRAVCKALESKDMDSANEALATFTQNAVAGIQSVEAVYQRLQQGFPAFPRVQAAQQEPTPNGRLRIVEP